jgi:formate hydrogenlyase subunit 6/NADH:ubiquinone oxidoreductase subunit I
VAAIVVGEDGPVFDHGLCIRCYCCQELCPPQVIGLKVPPIARFATRGRGK